MEDTVHMGAWIHIMVISVTNGAQMVSLQLRVLSKSGWTLGILCGGVGFVVVWRVRLLATSLRLVVSPVHTTMSSSLPLLVIGVGFIREVLLCIDLSLRSRRSRGQSRCRLHTWWVIGRSSWRGCKAYHIAITCRCQEIQSVNMRN